MSHTYYHCSAYYHTLASYQDNDKVPSDLDPIVTFA